MSTDSGEVKDAVVMGDVNIGDVHHHHSSTSKSPDSTLTSGLPDDVLSDEPVMPEVPIKVNNAIPVTIGICLILGSLLMGFSAYGNLSSNVMSATDATSMADGLNAQGANLTGEDVSGYFQLLDDAGYFSTLGGIELFASIVLMAGGVMLLKKLRLGVWVGAGGASLILLDAIVGMSILSSVESPDELLNLSMKIASAFWIGCGLFCLALPFIPLLVASGRAALK